MSIDYLIWFLIAQYVLSIINAKFDAYRISKGKDIAHWLNLTVFLIMVGIEIYIGKFIWWYAIIFFFTSCLNRRVFFGIPLNIFRSKHDPTIKWDYISKAKPPKAWLDRQEIKVFGYNGNAIHKTYIILLLIFTALSFKLWQ